jgi:CotS family spore coat protein
MEKIDKVQPGEFMPVEEIINNVLSEYNMKIYDIENVKFKDTDKQRAVYKITTDKGQKCLKKVYYNEAALLFIYSVIEWLNAKGIFCPRMIPSRKGLRYVKYNNNLFILTDWIDGRKCNYDNIDDISAAAFNLAFLHKCSYGFYPIDGSYIKKADTDYCQSYTKHFKQLLELSNTSFSVKDKFSKIYLEHFDYNIEAARESIYLLSKIDITVPLGDEVSMNAICHLDYVNKNIIFTPEGKLCIIDFDNTCIDMPVHDICGFLRRILKRESTPWDFNIFKTAVESYSSVRELSKKEFIMILAILMFPQKYWKISRDYYKNRNQCNKEAFITAIEQADQECGSCGCEFDPLYKKFLAMKDLL